MIATSNIIQIPNRYYKFAKLAIELAAMTDNSMIHSLCSLIVVKNRILSIGYNSRKTNPMMKTNMGMLHAECDALRKCYNGVPNNADVIVARTRKSGRPGMARPCIVCERALREHGVRRVFYTTNSDDPTQPILEEMKL